MSFKLKKIASRQECIASTISQQGTVVYDVSFFERESLNCMILKILPKPPKCQEVKIQTGTVLTSLTRKKGFQIILPSGDALQFVLVSAQSDKMQAGHHQKKSYIALLSTASAKGGRQ